MEFSHSVSTQIPIRIISDYVTISRSILPLDFLCCHWYLRGHWRFLKRLSFCLQIFQPHNKACTNDLHCTFYQLLSIFIDYYIFTFYLIYYILFYLLSEVCGCNLPWLDAVKHMISWNELLFVYEHSQQHRFVYIGCSLYFYCNFAG